MEYYLFRSFRPQKGPFPRLVPSQLFTIPREIPSLPKLPVNVAEYCLENNENNLFLSYGLVPLGIKVNYTPVINECKKTLTVEKASAIGYLGEAKFIHKVKYEHPVYGVMIDIQTPPCDLWDLGDVVKIISEGLNKRLLRKDKVQTIKWIKTTTVPFTLTETLDRTIHFHDIRGQGVLVGRHGMAQGGDYGFHICEKEEDRLAVLLCSCFLKVARPTPDPLVARKRRERRKEAKKKHAEMRAKDANYKPSRRGHPVQSKAVDLCDEVTGFKFKDSRHIIDNLKECFSYLLNSILYLNFDYNTGQTRPRFKQSLRLFIQFYLAFCEVLHAEFTMEAKETLNKILSALDSEDNLTSYIHYVKSISRSDLEEVRISLITQMNLSFSAVPPFVDLPSMPQCWQRAILDLKLFEVAMRVREKQDKVANREHGLFWRFNYGENLASLFPKIVGAILANRERKKVKFTGKGFYDYPKELPWGINIPPEITSLVPSGPILLTSRNFFVKSQNQFSEISSSSYSELHANVVNILSKEYICSFNRNYCYTIIFYKFNKGSPLTEKKVSINFVPHLDPVYTSSRVFMIQSGQCHVPCAPNSLIIVAIDLDYLFGEERIKQQSSKSGYIFGFDYKGRYTNMANYINEPSLASEFTYEFFNSDPETLEQLKKLGSSSNKYILCSTGKTLFLVISYPDLISKDFNRNHIAALEWSSKKKSLSFITKHETIDHVSLPSESKRTNRPAIAISFTYSNKPYLLHQPQSSDIDLTLWTLHRNRLLNLQKVSSLSKIQRMMPADDETYQNNYNLSLTKLDKKLFLCIECKQLPIIDGEEGTVSLPLYTLCRLKIV